MKVTVGKVRNVVERPLDFVSTAGMEMRAGNAKQPGSRMLFGLSVSVLILNVLFAPFHYHAKCGSHVI